MTSLTRERLTEVLWYCPDTGKFIWQESPRKGWEGKVAGSPTTQGYIQILIDKHPYRAHRLAWLYMTGSWPEGDIDHINRDKKDNRWENLRPCSRSDNCKNKSMQSNNTSGIIGISLHSKSGKWIAQVTVGGKRLRKPFSDLGAAISWRKEQEIIGEYLK